MRRFNTPPLLKPEVLALKQEGAGEHLYTRGQEVRREAEPEAEEKPLNEQVKVGGRLATYSHMWSFSSWAKSILSKGLGWAWIGGPPLLPIFTNNQPRS